MLDSGDAEGTDRLVAIPAQTGDAGIYVLKQRGNRIQQLSPTSVAETLRVVRVSNRSPRFSSSRRTIWAQ
ncbi:MAG: hypothetical protein R3E89_07900 [Thiolinea sp.]